MIIRDNRQKDVMVVIDFPNVNEEKRSEPYTDPSHTTLKDALGKASHIACKNLDTKYLLNSSTICYTYLSLTRYEAHDYDWKTSVTNKKNIPEGEEYFQVTWLKDVWVSKQIWNSIQGLLEQIRIVQPKLIVLGGKWAFLFLAVKYEEPNAQLTTIAITKSKPNDKKMFGGLNKFRSSLLSSFTALELPDICIIPILTPSFLFLVKEKDYVIKRDYAKIAELYKKLSTEVTLHDILQSPREAHLGLANTEVFQYLNSLLAILDAKPTYVSIDIETRHNAIDCIGIAASEYVSLTIPFSEMYEEINGNENLLAWKGAKGKEQLLPAPIGAKLTKYRSYWSLDDEAAICHLLWQVMLHPNCLHIGQNYNYDCQYYYTKWKLSIFSHCDTMILHHVLHNTLQKDLAMLASLYCPDYSYWKDEIEIKDNHTRWIYNGKDVQYTLSIAKILLRVMELHDTQLQEFYKFQQFEVIPMVVTLMNRGIKVDQEQKDLLNIKFTELMENCIAQINYIAMEEINLNSTPQVKNLFKHLLGIKPILNRKTKSESFGSDAMLVYLEQYPEWRTLLTLFLEYKSIKVFVKTFLSTKLDDDGRMRCNYNPAGTKTYRLSSRKNVFGNGMNLANIPSKGKIDLRIALQEYGKEEEVGKLTEETNEELEIMQFETEVAAIYEGKTQLPNCKKIFLPDSEDWNFFDGDYSAGDLHFVAWEADCKFIKDILKNKGDLYSLLASHYYQREILKKDEERQIFKSICHGANYLGQAPTLAAKAGLSIGAVKRVLEFYFHKCPEIHNWHKRLEAEARSRRCIRNIWGAKGDFIDFTDPMWLNKVVAWQPQSSLAILINKAICALEKQEQGKTIRTLMQTHDSAGGINLRSDLTAPQRIINYMEIEIPYKDKLIIPANIKISEKSYGDCH